MLDKDNTKAVFDFLNIKYQPVSSVKELLDSKLKADLCVISGLTTCNDEEKDLLRAYQSKGGKLFPQQQGNCQNRISRIYHGMDNPDGRRYCNHGTDDAPWFNQHNVLIQPPPLTQ